VNHLSCTIMGQIAVPVLVVLGPARVDCFQDQNVNEHIVCVFSGRILFFRGISKKVKNKNLLNHVGYVSNEF